MESYSKEVAQSAGYASRKLPIWWRHDQFEEHSVNKAYNNFFAISLSETPSSLDTSF